MSEGMPPFLVCIHDATPAYESETLRALLAMRRALDVAAPASHPAA